MPAITPGCGSIKVNSMNRELNIAKGLSTEIRVLMADSQEFCGRFFLADHSENHYGEETLLDLLNRPGKPFLPLDQGEEGPVVLIRKSRVAGLRPQHANSANWPKVDDGDKDSWPLAKIAFTELTLEGRVYTGDMPPQRRRLTDLLNHSDSFFVFETEEGPWIINKDLMKYLEPLS